MNYLTNDTELTAVADAIREKCDTSDSLEWPNGFIQAIEDCQTSGPELEWLWGNQITNTLSGTIDSTDDAYAGPILDLGVDGKSTQVTTTGKNLIPTTMPDNAIHATIVGGGEYSEATLNAAGNAYVFAIPCERNTDYYFSSSIKGAIGCLGLSDRLPVVNDTCVKIIIMTNYAARPIHTGENDYIFIQVANTAQFNAIPSNHGMLEKGSTVTDYEPYTGGAASPRPDYQRPILSVDGLGLMLIGKNLFDVDNATFANGYYYDNRYNGSYFSSTYARMVTTYTPIVGEATYTLSYSKDDTNQISCGIMFYDKDKVYVSGMTSAITSPAGEKSVTFTTPSNAKYIKFHLSLNSSNIQLEYGATATDYEPYIGTVIPLYDGTLRSLPNGTKDELHLAYLKPSKREGWA